MEPYRLWIEYNGDGEYTGTYNDFKNIDDARRAATVVRRYATLYYHGRYEFSELDIYVRGEWLFVELEEYERCFIYELVQEYRSNDE